MLVLSRKTGEQIVLPEAGVSITVLGVSGKRVRIGVEAPHDVAVHRTEIWQQVRDATKQGIPVGPAMPQLADSRSSA